MQILLLGAQIGAISPLARPIEESWLALPWGR
jgi:hypothetical protein